MIARPAQTLSVAGKHANAGSTHTIESPSVSSTEAQTVVGVAGRRSD